MDNMLKTITKQFVDGVGVEKPDFAPGQVVEILEVYDAPDGDALYLARNIVTGAEFYPSKGNFR